MVGLKVGYTLGSHVGQRVGSMVGLYVGYALGSKVGKQVGHRAKEYFIFNLLTHKNNDFHKLLGPVFNSYDAVVIYFVLR